MAPLNTASAHPAAGHGPPGGSTSTSTEGPPPAGDPAGGAPRPRERDHLTSLPAERVEAEILELTARMAVGTYELLVLVGELDHRGSYATWGALSAAAWLADRCEIEIGTAHSQVRVARAMRTHPALDSAMAIGDVSYAKARVMAPHLTAANAPHLLALACTHPAAQLGTAIAAWAQRNEDPGTIAQRQHEARSVTWRTNPDGTITITARLPPLTGGAICAVIDTHATRTRTPAGATLGQQRADALTALLPAVAHTPDTPDIPDGKAPARPAVQTELVIHVTEDGNHLPDGTPLADHAIASLLPAAFISLLHHNTHRHPIDASPRRRAPTRRQQRVLDQQHHTCQHPGCTATTHLQYDHITPYAQGGPTTLDNLQRLCGPHNRARHATTEVEPRPD